MSRRLRIEFLGATFQVMNRGLAARSIFHADVGEKHGKKGSGVFNLTLGGSSLLCPYFGAEMRIIVA